MSNESSNNAPTRERVFVTGGLGFIGAYLVRRLLDQGDEVLIYDNIKTYVSPLRNPHYLVYLQKRYDMLGGAAQIVEGDIRDYPHLKTALHNFKPDKIVHLAGLPIADVSDKYPHEAVSVNYNGTVNVLDAARDVPNLKKFVNISSSMVYGDFQYRPADEAHPTSPTGVYGATKLAAETMTRVYAGRFGFPYVTIRPSAVYGPTDCNRRVTQLFLEWALEGKPLKLHNGGTSALDFTHVEDASLGIFLATVRDDVKNETFNVTRGEGRTLLELATILQQLVPSVTVEHEARPEEWKRPERGAMAITKARALLGYEPRYALEDGMRQYLEFVESVRQHV